MRDDVILNKCETIRKCLRRVQEDYSIAPETFESDYTRQDAVILNLERAAQAAIDIAAHIVRVKRLGIPQSTRDLFILLEMGCVLSEGTSNNMQKMVGFRNIAVHDYQALNLDIVIRIVKSNLKDFEVFIAEILDTGGIKK